MDLGTIVDTVLQLTNCSLCQECPTCMWPCQCAVLATYIIFKIPMYI